MESCSICDFLCFYEAQKFTVQSVVTELEILNAMNMLKFQGGPVMALSGQSQGGHGPVMDSKAATRVAGLLSYDIG